MRRRVGLERDTVVRAAVQIADAEGINAVSMRRVSQALNVTPMALYRYIPDKDALIDLVIDESLRVVPFPDPTKPMVDEVQRCFGAIYDMLVDHPGLAVAVAGRPLEGPRAVVLGEQILTLLQAHGIDENAAIDVLVAAFGLCLGCALYQTSRSRQDEAVGSNQAADQPPTVRRVRTQHSAASGRDRLFREALGRLVEGYANTPTTTKAERTAQTKSR